MELIKTVDQFSQIRKWLEDEESKDVYDAITWYRLTGKYKYLYELIKKYYIDDKRMPGIGFADLIARNIPMQQDAIVIWGAAPFGYQVYDIMNELEIKITAACDSDPNKQGKHMGELVIDSPTYSVENNKDAVFLVTAIDYYVKVSIKEELLAMGVSEDRIVFALNYYGTQYYEPNIFELGDEEIFMDGGSLDCITCVNFRDWVNGKYKKIYTYEPDEKNHKDCLENIKKFNLKNVELLPYGLWDKKEELHFFNARGGSCISNSGESIIRTISIDETLNGEPATFIKMDIEGAELRALIGARETIAKYRPKLAISIYHKPEDLIEIPLIIKQLNPGYKLYIRHYSSMYFETVLYAI